MFIGNDWHILKESLDNLKGYELSDLCYLLNLPYSGTIAEKIERIRQTDSNSNLNDIIFKINQILLGKYIVNYFYAKDLAVFLSEKDLYNPRRKLEKYIEIIKKDIINPKLLLEELDDDDLSNIYYDIFEKDTEMNREELIEIILQNFNLNDESRNDRHDKTDVSEGLISTLQEKTVIPTINNFVFVVMPFTEYLTKIYVEIIKPTIENIGLFCRRADEYKTNTPIYEDVLKAINDGQIIVADLTDLNPNVMFELGIAYKSGKKIIIIYQKKDKDIKFPSNLSHIRRIEYEDTALGGKKLENDLRETILTILRRSN